MTAPSEIGLKNRNLRIGLICGAVFATMVGVSFAAVPLYRMYCQVTGFDGTVSKADQAPNQILEQTVTIRFDTNARDIDWSFKAEQVSQTVKIGATQLAFFKVTNDSDQTVTGRASYNVLPETVGAYFQKLECFCFTDQTLKPGESIEFPVVYFVDPRLAENDEVKDTKEITLSYTFFPSEVQVAAGQDTEG